MSLEDKVDLILEYHQSARRWAIARLIIDLVVIFLVVVVPIILLFYAGKYIAQNVDTSKWGDTLNQLKNGSEQLKQLPGLLNKLPGNLPK